MVAIVAAVIWVLVLLIGAVLRWRWLVDPPHALRWVYLPAIMRSFMSVERTRAWLIGLCLFLLVLLLWIASVADFGQ